MAFFVEVGYNSIMSKRIFLLVIDGLGVGHAHDGRYPEDIGSNTLLHIMQETHCYLPTLKRLGLLNMPSIDANNDTPVIADYAILNPLSVGKDSCMGHWEMAGCITKEPFANFTQGYPDDIVEVICTAFGCEQVLLNRAYSDTKALNDYGDRHMATGFPIVYTNTESCLSIACHGAMYSTEELHYACEYIAKNLPSKYNICRVIARPFAGIKDNYYYIKERKDYTLSAPKNLITNILTNHDYEVISVGKVFDLFGHQGFTTAYETYSNQQVFDALDEIVESDFEGLCFANFGDSDVLYGHRNDAYGFKECLYRIDEFLSDFISRLGEDDVLMITADHGNDPLTASTDHSREMLPLIIYQPHLSRGVYLGDFMGLNHISDYIKKYFDISKKSELYKKIEETRE